ncbi:uncharacterized protein TRIVIDRAFT_111109 [Trichoderma virens Gv29-8]|uniref:Uncharacterized protein n=1 Tax=Hypocrea virens (strain Gv29-8 / FGSC 10586) TaxID=413071 RepID=G9MP20_HYPVG|nr:uncharacterized protein TRIVIDRAFT_111109 [Trichoderma virens Gv29-8]EHK23622.1 hypothetical protein TRIVIDRAFT_111109 [Trichoderma virens Gv29-8]
MAPRVILFLKDTFSTVLPLTATVWASIKALVGYAATVWASINTLVGYVATALRYAMHFLMKGWRHVLSLRIRSVAPQQSNSTSCDLRKGAWKVCGGILAVLTFIAGILALWISLGATRYAKWTSQKDFLLFCMDESTQKLSHDCQMTADFSLPAPPGFNDHTFGRRHEYNLGVLPNFAIGLYKSFEWRSTWTLSYLLSFSGSDCTPARKRFGEEHSTELLIPWLPMEQCRARNLIWFLMMVAFLAWHLLVISCMLWRWISLGAATLQSLGFDRYETIDIQNLHQDKKSDRSARRNPYYQGLLFGVMLASHGCFCSIVFMDAFDVSVEPMFGPYV